jgi:hypothetical protein
MKEQTHSKQLNNYINESITHLLTHSLTHHSYINIQYIQKYNTLRNMHVRSWYSCTVELILARNSNHSSSSIPGRTVVNHCPNIARSGSTDGSKDVPADVPPPPIACCTRVFTAIFSSIARCSVSMTSWCCSPCVRFLFFQVLFFGLQSDE